MSLLAEFVRDNSAATAIEYAMIAGAIAVVIVTAVRAIGSTLATIYTNVSTGLAP